MKRMCVWLAALLLLTLPLRAGAEQRPRVGVAWRSDQQSESFVATCEAQRLDDIIVEIHRAGLELVTLHDRPEGSRLGAYHYLVEAKNDNGITKQQLETVRGIPEVRFLGCFQSMSKTPTP